MIKIKQIDRPTGRQWKKRKKERESFMLFVAIYLHKNQISMRSKIVPL
jgi:hypothetical protein